MAGQNKIASMTVFGGALLGAVVSVVTLTDRFLWNDPETADGATPGLVMQPVDAPAEAETSGGLLLRFRNRVLLSLKKRR